MRCLAICGGKSASPFFRRVQQYMTMPVLITHETTAIIKTRGTESKKGGDVNQSINHHMKLSCYYIIILRHYQAIVQLKYESPTSEIS